MSAEPFTEYELSEIIKLAWSTNVWSNKEWYTKQILQQNGIKKLNKYFKLLLNTDIPVSERYEQFNENIKFLGAAFTTEILCHLEPINAAIWNAKSSALMRFLEVKGVNATKYINYKNFSAKDYDNFNKFMKQLLTYINTSAATKNKLFLNDLLELDYLVWKLYALISEEYPPHIIRH